METELAENRNFETELLKTLKEADVLKRARETKNGIDGVQVMNVIEPFIKGSQEDKRQSAVEFNSFLITKIIADPVFKEVKHVFDNFLTWERDYSEEHKQHRDHIIHSVYVYLLGLFLWAKSSVIKGAICDRGGRFPVFWAATGAVFHDIGYVFKDGKEAAEKFLASTQERSFPIARGLPPFITSYSKLEKEDQLLWCLLDSYLRRDLGYTGPPLFPKFVCDYSENKIPDHALVSGYLFAKWLAPNGVPSDAISEIASAIISHTSIDLGIKLDWSKTRLYNSLLLIADELQEWGRLPINDAYIKPSDYYIEFSNEYHEVKEVLICVLNLTEDQVKKKNERLRSRLSMDHLEIRFEALPKTNKDIR